MASIALDPAYRRVSVEEFLDMDFGDAKAELDDGIIYMMAGGNISHARVAANLIAALHGRLRGSGCFPLGSDFATRTGERSIRYPDVSVYCGRPMTDENRGDKLIGDPRVVFEVLSPSTEQNDQRIKLIEYQSLSGVDAIVFVNPLNETIRLVSRQPAGWSDIRINPGADLAIPSLGLAIPHADIFARD